MTKYLRFETPDGDPILVAVDGLPERYTERAGLSDAPLAVVNKASIGFDAALGVVAAVAKSFTSQFIDGPNSPSQMELTFGLEVSAELNVFAVAKADSKGSFQLKLSWTPPTQIAPIPPPTSEKRE